LLADLAGRDVLRVPGTAIFPHPSDETVPLALRSNVERNNILHEHVIIISAGASRLAHVAPEDQLRATNIGPAADGIVHLDLRYGFFDQPDIPTALAHAATSEPALADADLDNATYFLSRASLALGRSHGMAMWRKHLFLLLAHNAANPGHTFALPPAHHHHGKRDRDLSVAAWGPMMCAASSRHHTYDREVTDSQGRSAAVHEEVH
jgi:KUP system potassium uptake protein